MDLRGYIDQFFVCRTVSFFILLAIMIEGRKWRMNESDFRLVFQEHKDAVYRFAWRMTNSPSNAEDIAQEVFLLLLCQPERFDPSRGQLRSFLLGIARKLAQKCLQKQGRWYALDEDQFVIQPVDIERRETAEVVGTAVYSLPPLQREVLLLAYYEGLSLDEIAQAVHVEIGTVKGRLHRARENLRRLLSGLRQPNERAH
jgi:RNA polymerase sigma-70 factor, ECF subfamily